MELKAGYKNTEVGVIPEDWIVKKLSEIGKFSKGSGVRKDEALSGNIPCVRYGELYTRHSDYIKQFYSFISKDISFTAKRLKKGDILFAGSGETKAEIGKSVAFINEFEAFAGGDIVILSPDNTNSLYLGYLLNAPFIQKQKASRGQGDAIVHISSAQLGNVLLPLPIEDTEQTAIANALSDADTLISSLEKLIAKKRNIKQGAMQELLKPKEGWEVKKLGKVAEIRKGEQLNRAGLSNYDLYPVINGGVLPSGYTDVWNQKTDTIIISEGGNSCGYINFIKTNFWQGGHCYSLETKINKEFLFHLLKSNEKEIMALRVGSGLPNIQRNRLVSYEIHIPKPEEQTKIATILTDMDAEIQVLEMKLEKFKNVKLGMMQNLLTGKIRIYDNN